MAHGFDTAGTTPVFIEPITYTISTGTPVIYPADPSSIHDIVLEATNRYGTNFQEVWNMIGCETQGTYDPLIQSYNILWYGRELSFGLAQIHLPDHPNITQAQATNPFFAADFIAKNWEAHKDWWKCNVEQWLNSQ